MATLHNKTKNSVVAREILEARSHWSRLKGLLGTNELPLGKTLWIPHCNSIHTCFMNYAIDAIFVDRNLRVRSIQEDLWPWRMTFPDWKATSVFELPAGTAKKCAIEIGDQLHVDP